MYFYTGLEKTSQWFKENMGELKSKVQKVRENSEKTGGKSGYLDIKNWIENNAPRDADYPNDPKEEKYEHVTAILEQASREPKPSPKLIIADKPFDKLTIDDFELKDYDYHSAIRREMLV